MLRAIAAMMGHADTGAGMKMPKANAEKVRASEDRRNARGEVAIKVWVPNDRTELLEDWELCARKQSPKKIAPLP